MQTETYAELLAETKPRQSEPPQTTTPETTNAPGAAEAGDSATKGPAGAKKEDTSTGGATAPASDAVVSTQASSISAPSTVNKLQNVALVSAAATVDPGVADIIERVRSNNYKGSPAERRKTVYADMERLRTRGIYLRDSAEDIRTGGNPDEAEAKRLVDRAKQCEQTLSELGAVYEALLSRAERRAGRDANLKSLERDPTGKKWKGSYIYDPRRAEMRELYKEKTHPAHVIADGAKLIRNDGGQYGLIGSHLILIHDAEQRAGEAVSEKLRVELLKLFAYDALERGHGMGAGYNRDAAWILQLWADATKTPLDLEDLPVRHPLKSFDDWAETEFPVEYEKGLNRAGMKTTAAEDGEVL